MGINPSRFVLLSCALIVVGEVRAQRVFTAADFQGGYAFSLERGQLAEPSVGVLVADGAGNVTAQRVVEHRRRGINEREDVLLDLDPIAQEGTGTYTVEASGMAVLSITWSPTLLAAHGGTACLFQRSEPIETWRLALTDGDVPVIAEIGTQRVDACTGELHDIVRTSVGQGRLVRQEARCPEAPASMLLPRRRR